MLLNGAAYVEGLIFVVGVDLIGVEDCLPADVEQGEGVEDWGIKHGWAPLRFFAEDAPALDILQVDTEVGTTSVVHEMGFCDCSCPIGSTVRAEYLF